MKHRPKRFFTEEHPDKAAWWDKEKNEPGTLESLTSGARRHFHWRCPDGHTFESSVHGVVSSGCPTCWQIRSEEFNRERNKWKQTPVSEVPELIAAWRDEADPSTVMVGDFNFRTFECPRGHHPRMRPELFMQSGCMYCRGVDSRRKEKKMFADYASPELLQQWHPDNKLSPAEVIVHSTRSIRWRSQCCGYEWEASLAERAKRYGSIAPILCPRCETIQNSLAVQLPDLAAEWSPRNDKTPQHYLPFSKVSAEWICSDNPEHVWTAALSARTQGAGCPDCAEAGKSKVELEHFHAAVETFGNARSGQRVRSSNFVNGTSWLVDILVDLNGQPLAIEYDGSYWHMDQEQIAADLRKTGDLIRAKYLIVRLREKGLPPLPIQSTRYLELEVHPQAPRPGLAMQRIADWLHQLGVDQG